MPEGLYQFIVVVVGAISPFVIICWLDHFSRRKMYFWSSVPVSLGLFVIYLFIIGTGNSPITDEQIKNITLAYAGFIFYFIVGLLIQKIIVWVQIMKTQTIPAWYHYRFIISALLSLGIIFGIGTINSMVSSAIVWVIPELISLYRIGQIVVAVLMFVISYKIIIRERLNPNKNWMVCASERNLGQ